MILKEGGVKLLTSMLNNPATSEAVGTGAVALLEQIDVANINGLNEVYKGVQTLLGTHNGNAAVQAACQNLMQQLIQES